MNMKIVAAAFIALASITLVSVARAQDVLDENADLPAPNPEVEKQYKGEFPKVPRADPTPLGAIQKAWEGAPPTAGIYKVKWSPDNTTQLATRLDMPTVIRLPAWEQIETVILGDTYTYRAEQLNDTTELIYTVIPGKDTSLTILGESGNIYNFRLQSETWKSNQISDIVVYIDAPQPPEYAPDDSGGSAVGPVSVLRSKGDDNFHLASFTTGAGSAGRKKKPEWLKGVPFDPNRIRRDLALYGDAELAPEDVFRDDQFTYLCYGERWDDGDLMVATPAVVTDGTDRPVNFRIKSGCMIIASTGQLSLKHGNSVLCIKPDPERAQPRVSAAAERVRPLKPKTAEPSVANQPAPSVPTSSPLAPAGPIAVQPLPPVAGGTPTAGAGNPAPIVPDVTKSSGR